MKTNNPGCLCCGADCTDACYFPCTGGTEGLDCQVCGIDIQLPTPETTGLDPLTIVPPGCDDEAPCWQCYEWFDRVFSFPYFGGAGDVLPPIGEGACNNYQFTWELSGPYQYIYPADGTIKIIYIDPCWEANNYNCPYDNTLGFWDCPGSNVALSTRWTNRGGPAQLVLTGNEWDGSCGKITLTIRYAVTEFVIGTTTPPITEPEGCEEPKWSEFLYTFELEYCTCEELFNAFTFVSVSVTDSCAGSVADPCKMDEAVIRLKKRPEEKAFCNICNCMNCPDYRSDKISLTISGPVINGTFIIDGFRLPTGLAECFYIYRIPFEGCPEIRDLQINLRCLPCDLFKAFLTIQFPYTYWSGATEPFNCGDSPVFTKQSFNPAVPNCQIDNHTFTLSMIAQ